jgi:hypothetical protein
MKVKHTPFHPATIIRPVQQNMQLAAAANEVEHKVLSFNRFRKGHLYTSAKF